MTADPNALSVLTPGAQPLIVEDGQPHLEDRIDRIRPREMSSILLWGILAFFAIAVAWAALARIDRTVRGPGRVIPSAQLQIVSNLEGGIVEAILVRVGQMVRSGAPLVRLDQTQSGADYGSSRAQFDALDAKIARLEAEVDGRPPTYPANASPAAAEQIAIERALHASRMADLSSLLSAASSRVAQAERSVAEARASLSARQSAEAAARSELSMIRPLVERGIEPRLALVQADNGVAVAAGEAAAASAAVARALSSVAEARATLNQQRQDWRSRAATELATARAEFVARRQAMPALASRVARTVVRSPLDGRVNRVMVTTVGGTVRPGDPLVEVVPSENALLVEARVDPRDIARVRVDQPARVELTAYESSVYGTLDGRVVALSPDAVVDERTGESHYVVRVRTQANALKDSAGRPLPIGPGMVATVSLLGDKRSVLSYLLTPITRLSETAFRE